MKLSDLRKEDDFFDLLDESSEDKPKKKKKKDKESKPVKFDGSEIGLKAMKRKELVEFLVSHGIPHDISIRESKKEMRRCIKAWMNGSSSTTPSGGMLTTAEAVGPVGLTQPVKERPPYYHDEDTGDFVIPQALDTDDMNCFNAMMALGAIRREHRPSDGFGELTGRLHKKIQEAAAGTSPKEIIEVTDFSVEPADEPKALPAPKAEHKPAPKPKKPDVIDISPEEAEQLSADIDKVLAKAKTKPKKK